MVSLEFPVFAGVPLHARRVVEAEGPPTWRTRFDAFATSLITTTGAVTSREPARDTGITAGTFRSPIGDRAALLVAIADGPGC